MKHQISLEDRNYQNAFEGLQMQPGDFDHASHVRLAYIYLCRRPAEPAAMRMKNALLGFLDFNGIGRGKYHETLTKAWILAVHHFMTPSAACTSAGQFIAQNSKLLDREIMLTHYSAAVLFSDTARASFVTPDIQAIPAS